MDGIWERRGTCRTQQSQTEFLAREILEQFVCPEHHECLWLQREQQDIQHLGRKHKCGGWKIQKSEPRDSARQPPQKKAGFLLFHEFCSHHIQGFGAGFLLFQGFCSVDKTHPHSQGRFVLFFFLKTLFSSTSNPSPEESKLSQSFQPQSRRDF